MLKLEELRKKLLFNTSLDVWIALCEDNSIDWFDPIAYEKFVDYRCIILRSYAVPLVSNLESSVSDNIHNDSSAHIRWFRLCERNNVVQEIHLGCLTAHIQEYNDSF